MGARITRAEGKIIRAGIVSDAGPEDLPARGGGVQAVLFLIFKRGICVPLGQRTGARAHGRGARCTALVRAAARRRRGRRTLALMLLTDARRSARCRRRAKLVPLAEQDRGQWDAELIAEGHALVRARLASGLPPGRYQLLAAINAVHTDGDATDWAQVVALYDHLVRLDGSPIVRLNRAIAVGERDGPAAGLALIDTLAPALHGYHSYHAARARLLQTGWSASRSPRRLRRGDRAGGEHGRARVPHAAARRASEWGLRWRETRNGAVSAQLREALGLARRPDDEDRVTLLEHRVGVGVRPHPPSGGTRRW